MRIRPREAAQFTYARFLEWRIGQTEDGQHVVPFDALHVTIRIFTFDFLDRNPVRHQPVEIDVEFLLQFLVRKNVLYHAVQNFLVVL